MVCNALYDGKASLYESAAGSERYRAMELRTVLRATGPVAGRDILDLGCGTGWWGRQMLARGARCVMGVDGTRDMLVEARRLSIAGGSRLILAEGDIRTWSADVPFHIVIAVWVLCHASTVHELTAMYRCASSALPPNGQFVAVINNPAYRLDEGDGAAYGGRVIEQTACPDGHRIVYELASNPPLRVVDHQWSAAAHQAAARAAGFGKLSWVRLAPSSAERAACPARFRDELECNPFSVVIHCRA